MNRLIACVPNFSEGRNPATIQALMASVGSVPDVWILDHTMDADHHRSVLTLAGSPEAVGEAAVRLIRLSTKLIDLRSHEGVHPRVGATDVVPFVPIQGVTIEDCVQLARRIGSQVGSELHIPVFLYEQATTNPEHVNLEAIRRGGLAGLASRMEAGGTWTPDFGPARLHETAGAIVIGARRPLIAFNVNLKTDDLSAAKAIAKAVRESDGGLPCVKAIGVKLASRGIVQVAMNLTDFHITPLAVAFEAVKRQAGSKHLEIAGCELIGLLPQEALDRAVATWLKLEPFDRMQIFEERMRAAMSGSVERATSLTDFLNAVASEKPTPAGGSVAAMVGALAASLGVMGARLSHRKDAQEQFGVLSERLHALVHADIQVYQAVSRILKRSKDSPEHARQLVQALDQATEVPMEIAELACQAGLLIHSCIPSAKPPVQSDLTVGMIMAIAAAEAGLHTVKTNTKSQPNHEVNEKFHVRMGKTIRSLEELKGLCYTPPS